MKTNDIIRGQFYAVQQRKWGGTWYIQVDAIEMVENKSTYGKSLGVKGTVVRVDPEGEVHFQHQIAVKPWQVKAHVGATIEQTVAHIMEQRRLNEEAHARRLEAMRAQTIAKEATTARAAEAVAALDDLAGFKARQDGTKIVLDIETAEALVRFIEQTKGA